MNRNGLSQTGHGNRRDRTDRTIAKSIANLRRIDRTIAKSIANLKDKRPEIVANDAKKTLPLLETWQEWRGEFRPGCYTHDDLMVVRRAFLESGRNPKISIWNLAEYSQLAYRCSKKIDGETGLCVVRERPQDYKEITE